MDDGKEIVKRLKSIDDSLGCLLMLVAVAAVAIGSLLYEKLPGRTAPTKPEATATAP